MGNFGLRFPTAAARDVHPTPESPDERAEFDFPAVNNSSEHSYLKVLKVR